MQQHDTTCLQPAESGWCCACCWTSQETPERLPQWPGRIDLLVLPSELRTGQISDNWQAWQRMWLPWTGFSPGWVSQRRPTWSRQACTSESLQCNTTRSEEASALACSPEHLHFLGCSDSCVCDAGARQTAASGHRHAQGSRRGCQKEGERGTQALSMPACTAIHLERSSCLALCRSWRS